MKQIEIQDDSIKNKEKRDAYYKVLDFINSDRCFSGIVEILFGLQGTGKTTIMQQLVINNSDSISFMFVKPDGTDTMEDVYSFLDKAIEDNVKCVLIDDITIVSDFIDNSAELADIYAKQGLRIVLAGDDSLCFVYAEKSSLYDRTEHINTTYIPFAEYCRVLTTDSLDDYVCFGGLMKKNTSADSIENSRAVYDYVSARRYLDTAVAQNISRSLEKLSHFANRTALMNVSEKQMRRVIKKSVERYCGVKNQDAFNADTDMGHKFDDDMMLSLENALISLGFLSATNKQVLLIDEFGYRTEPPAKEYYIIQPAVKYHCLIIALGYVNEKENNQRLSTSGKQVVTDVIATQIKAEMTKQIGVYETLKALSSSRYMVTRLCFKSTDNYLGGFDMLVYDKQQNCCWGFEIDYSAQASPLQYKNLADQRLLDAVNYMYGEIKGLCVLYNGKPFKTDSGIAYLNLSDFLKHINDYKDFELFFAKNLDSAEQCKICTKHI